MPSAFPALASTILAAGASPGAPSTYASRKPCASAAAAFLPATLATAAGAFAAAAKPIAAAFSLTPTAEVTVACSGGGSAFPAALPARNLVQRTPPPL